MLTEDNTSLEEVVVVGYGVQKKRDIVGAVEQISSKDIADRIGSYQNVSRSLQGAIPGLTVTFSDGKPTRGASFQVRGANSIGAGGSALILVDGVETDITTVNSEDIESISVLKDASSTAVYGSRGTFGVILITTKRPEKGQMKITYNGSYNFYKRTVTPELVDNGYDWTTSYLEAYTNSYATDPTNINNVFRFSRAWYSELERRNSDPSYEKWRINPADNRYEYFGNTNWYKIFYKDYTTGHQHNLSITGGTDKASYYVSGRFFHQDGIYNAGDERYNQYNVLAKGTVQATKWLRVENTTSFMSRFSHQPTLTTGGQSFTVTPTRMMNHQGFPMTLEKNPDGTWTDAAVYMGWAGFVEGNTWREDDKFDLNNKTKFTLDFIKDVLVGEIDVSYYRNHTERHMLAVPYTYYTGPESSGERPATSWYEERYYNRERVASNAVLTWTPKLGENHWLKLMGGWNIENMDYTSTLGQNTGVIDPEHPSLSLTDGELPKAQGNGSYSASLVGTFFRVNYGYKGKYLVEGSGRYDGNSKFPSNQRWGFFPSASVGWRISEEPFMAGAKSWLDNLKIRASFGSTGNGQVDNYLFLSKIAIKKNLGFLTGDSPLIYADKPSLIPDGLTWETVSTYDLGLDWEMLNGRLSIVADIYRKNTTDMYVVGPELPAVFGNSAPKGNYADMRTDGWEASISWRDNFKLGGKDFSYNLKFAIWDKIHGHDQHAADQLRHQLLRRHDAGRVVGLHLQRTVPEQRRGANLRRLLEVRAEQDRMAEGRPEIRRPQRRRPHRQRLQPAGRPRRPVDHRQHLAPLLLQPRRGCTLERHRPLDGLAGRRPPRLVPRQRVGLLLGTVRPAVQHRAAVAQRPLHRCQPEYRRLLAASDRLHGTGCECDPFAAQYPLLAEGPLRASEKPDDRLHLPQADAHQDRHPEPAHLPFGREPVHDHPAEKVRQELRPREHLRRRLRLFEHARRRRFGRRRRLSRHAFVQHRFEYHLLI